MSTAIMSCKNFSIRNMIPRSNITKRLFKIT